MAPIRSWPGCGARWLPPAQRGTRGIAAPATPDHVPGTSSATARFPAALPEGGPPGGPADRIRKLNADVRKVLDEPAVKDQLAKMGAVPAGSMPEQSGRQIRDDSAKWGRVIKEQDIHAQ
ncbi:MAG TPA: tripartite tricarboxylate transporter substrate-binding protein [Bordetella sp.]|nr:tripartite tricarboxylate transporter substrate-binding protein [Bordetella sp.]